MRNQLRALDDSLRARSIQFDRFPTKNNYYVVKSMWDQKLRLMQQISDLVNGIISTLTEATKIILTSMQSSLEVNNRLSITLNDNAIGSIYSFAELNQYQLDVKEMYRQSCLMQNIPSLLSDIEIKMQMMRLSLPNFENLKRLIGIGG